MSSSVTLSIATNSTIAAAKAFGWFLTGSPTLFAETVHSLADVGNQVLLKVGEIRSHQRPDVVHPFGTGQEKFFWALVSAVSIFFIGCGINVYHGIQALLLREEVEPFGLLVMGLLVFSFALEAWTFRVALKEIGGWNGVRKNRHNTPVLAVLLEDSVALLGIVLTLVVGGISYFFGPQPEIDAFVAIGVGVLLGAMAIFLAALNRRLLIDTSDPDVDRWAERWLQERGITGQVRSLVLDNDRVILFVQTGSAIDDSCAMGEALTSAVHETHTVQVDTVYWRFLHSPAAPALTTPG